MRVSVLILVLSVGSLVGWSRSAAAEKVKTNQSTKVYSRPGEHAKVLLKLKSGQNMTVLAREGRWIKVRVEGRTGYVPRSKVDEPDDGELVRNTRRRPFVDGRGTKRGFGGQAGPDDRIGADAVGDGSDSADSSDDGDGDGGDKGDKASKGDKTSKGGKGGKASKGDKAKHDDDADDDDSDDDDASASSKHDKAKPQAKHSDDDGDDDSADDDSDDSDDGGSASAKSGRSAKSDSHAKKDDDSDDDSGDDDKSDKGDKGDGDDVVDDDKTGDPEPDKRPTAHVVKKTVAYDKSSEDSDENFTAKPDMVLYPSDKKGKWTFVEDDEGDAGWVRTSDLRMDGGDDDDDGGGASSHARQLAIRAGVGVTFLQEGLHSAGATPPMQGTLNLDNYTIGSPVMTLALGGGVLYPYGKRWMLGGEATLDYGKTLLGGISVPTTTTSTGVGLMVFDLTAEAGYDLHKKNGMTIFGRLGYRYSSFSVDNYNDFTKNPAKLPQETIGAPTLGVALAIPKLTPKLGLAFTLDTVLAGASITQTKGLEDGASPKEKAAYVGAVLTYRWKKDMDLQAAYRLDYESIDFGKPVMTSMRAHTGTDVTRTDLDHLLTVGVTKGF